MVVPNGPVLSSLGQVMPALCSSLFILFTAGIFVSLVICLFAVLILKPGRGVFSFLAALTVSGLILVTFADQSLFLRTRDYLLLSNPPGIAVNNFYYTYTPYAARAIQPHPDKGLQKYVQQLCAAGLFTGLPVFCFMVLFGFIFFICRKRMPEKTAWVVSGILVPWVALISLLYLYPAHPPNNMTDKMITDNMTHIRKMLASQKSKTRIEALRILYHKSRDIWQFPEYCSKQIHSHSIAEKYWLAKAFSRSDAKKSIPCLKQLIRDDAVNVKTAAIKALLKLSCDADAVRMFKKLMLTSPQWYVQQAAYTAFNKCR